MSDIKKFPIPEALAENDRVSHRTYSEGTLGNVLNPQGDQYTSGPAPGAASTENSVDRALPPVGASSTEQEQLPEEGAQVAGEAQAAESSIPPLPEFGAPQPPSPEEARHAVEEALGPPPPEQQ